MKWVWIRPLVLQPQTKKVANSTQKMRHARGSRARERRQQQRHKPDAGRRRRRTRGFAVERQIEIARPVAHQRRSATIAASASTPQTKTSAMRQPNAVGQLGDERQEHQLAGRRARRQHADDQAAAVS